MRVAINGWFSDQPNTGSGQYTRQLLTHLLHVGPEHEYFLVTPDGASQITNAEWVTTRQRGHVKPGIRKVWFEQITFPRACRRLEADVAHVPYWGSPLRPGVPTVVTVHDIIPLLLPEYRGSARVRAYTALVQNAAAKAALVLTDSECSRRDILTHKVGPGGLPDTRVRVVYLAADASYSPNRQPDDDAIRARYGLPDEYVLYISGFDVRKNVVNMLQAWTFAEGILGAQIPLVIAGRLPEHSAFTPNPRRVAQALEIDPDTLIFTGPIDEVHKPALYRGAVCLLLPSRYEGFGLPALEALSCGVPVIGSNASSIPEVVGDAGVLVSPDNVRGMAGALIAIATEPDTRDQLSGRALAQAAKFSWEKTARETLAAFEELLS